MKTLQLALLLSTAAFAQFTPGGGGTLQVSSDPAGACTVAALMQYNYVSGSLWGCKNGTWTQVSGGSGTAAWGSITGTLSSQTDLNTALAGKASSTASTTVNGQTCTLGSSCTISLSAINPQTSTYQALAADFSNYKTITVASGTFTITLVASGSQPANGQYIKVINYGSGVVTIARSGQNINGGTSSITLAAGSATAPTSAVILSDGTNYFASTSATGGNGGSNITSGTYSSLPAACTHTSTASDAYQPSDSFYNFICTATNTWSAFMDGKQATLPTAASTWTLVNGSSGTAAKADSNGAVTLSTTSSVLGQESILKALPSAPYTKIIAFRYAGYTSTSSSGTSIFGCAVHWTNGTATSSSIQGLFFYNVIVANVIQPIRMEVDHYTSFAFAGGAADASFFNSITYPTGTIWVKLTDDNTNRKIYFSNDGQNFVQLYSTARGTPFTPTNYGVGCGYQTAGSGNPWLVTLLSDFS